MGGGQGRAVKGLACGAALLLFSIGFFGCKAVSDNSDKAVVNVNKRAITYAQYQDALKRLVPVMEETEDISEIKKDLINRLIEEELILQEADRLGVTVSDPELSAEVEGLKLEYGDDSFKDAIVERYGTMDNWKERLKRKLLIRKTIDKATGPAKGPAEAEAKGYYEEHIGEYRTPETVKARMIVVADREEALKIRAELTPANFAAIAEEKSLSPERASGGDLGFFARGEMPLEFEEVVFSLRPGEISGVVKTEYGYHIFLVEEKKKAGKLKFSEVKGRIMEQLRLEKADAEFVDWMVSLKRGADIKVREEML
ncbi:MAG: peptidyl-prolyl cis-trans isomerase [Deltaproteobacteria bacterium]|nr:peptidyl-prolyl cis-trans isomerase [Deltaproteobacteria bacterium]